MWKIFDVPTDKLDELSDYDMVFVNGMGLRIVEEERALIQEAADKGIPVYTTMATNPANNICSLGEEDIVKLAAYLSGGRKNYRNMLNYIRKEIDGKKSSVVNPGEPVERPWDILYHAGVKDSDEELEFTTVKDYEKFLRDNGLFKENGYKIVVTGQMADATGLIAALEKEGHNVYPISSLRKLLPFMREIAPDAVINMAHGRLGDAVVDFLKERNILLFSPLTINDLVENWENVPAIRAHWGLTPVS